MMFSNVSSSALSERTQNLTLLIILIDVTVHCPISRSHLVCSRLPSLCRFLNFDLPRSTFLITAMIQQSNVCFFVVNNLLVFSFDISCYKLFSCLLLMFYSQQIYLFLLLLYFAVLPQHFHSFSILSVFILSLSVFCFLFFYF